MGAAPLTTKKTIHELSRDLKHCKSKRWAMEDLGQPVPMWLITRIKALESAIHYVRQYSEILRGRDTETGK